LRSFADFSQLDLTTAVNKFHDLKELSGSSISLAEGMMSAYLFVISHWENITSGDWTCLLLGKNTAKKFEAEVQLLKQQYVFIASGRLEELSERYGRNEKTFNLALQKCIKEGDTLSKQATSSNQKIALQRYISDLREIETNVYLMRAGSPDRQQPFGLLLSGPSKTGKSTLVNQLCAVIIDEYGSEYENGMVTTANIEERFESTVEPTHKIIVCDDVANNSNAKPNFDRVLNYVNTVPRSLEKASVEEKGKKYPMNDACIVTTNVPHLNAVHHSNCPESILRRFGLHVDVEIAPEFRTPAGGIVDMDETRFDVYELTVKRFSHIDETCPKDSCVVYDVVPFEEWNPTTDHKNDIAQFLQFLRKEVRAHIVRQKKRAVVQRELRDGGLCEACKNPCVVCACETPQAENLSDVMALATNQLWDVRNIVSSYGLTASSNMKSLYFTIQFYLYLVSHRNYYRNVVYGSCLFFFMTCIVAVLIGSPICVASVLIWAPALLFYLRKSAIAEVDQILSARADALSSICLTTKDYCKRYAKHAVIIVSTIYFMYTLYNRIRRVARTRHPI
jgi:energy-coupling factor transporter ATP-binding protein EcfA2